MKTLILLITILIFSIIFSSCVQNSGIELPLSDKVMVLNGILNPDSTIVVSLTSSRNIATLEEVEDIRNATITIYEDGNLIGTMAEIPPGQSNLLPRTIYTLDYKPIVGRTYQIKGEKAGFETIESKTIIPEKSGEIIDFEYLGKINNYSQGIKLHLLDTEVVENYFHLVIYQTDTLIEELDGEIYKYYGQEQASFFGLNESDLESELLQSNRHGFLLSSDLSGLAFTDKLFNQKSISFSIILPYPYIENSSNDTFQYTSKLRFELRSITKDYFDFQKSIALQFQARNNPLAEPVFIFNNIDNGFGNFSAFNSINETLTIKSN